ncbi:hypothetical protein D3227_31940 [Mesorhizobium waimense]|uniref:Uncharacterized protein n=1 Tax=Mesorhizobium waimense TaxID=1300307 RepID=A0A3A5KAT5_9HYPH|nr:hypothetical protein D3227_31940 [Mesorhizobium waimense]
MFKIVAKGIDTGITRCWPPVLGLAAGGQPAFERAHAQANPRRDLPWRQAGLPQAQDFRIAVAALNRYIDLREHKKLALRQAA